MAWPPASEMITATLARGNARWPAYLTGSPWQRRVVDNLYEGDRLTLPKCAAGPLVICVVDGFLRLAVPIPHGGGTFMIDTDCVCPDCGRRGVHDIVVHVSGRMGRICCACEHDWTHTAECLGVTA